MLYPTKSIVLIGTTAMMLMMMSRCTAFVVPSRIQPTRVLGALGLQTATNNQRRQEISEPVSSKLASSLTSTTSNTRLFSATAESASAVLKRVKTIDAVEPTEDPVIIKGWVKTIRKQKTLAFVQVNDGSNLKGIQCVLSFDDIDEQTKKGKYCLFLNYVLLFCW
jgi:hypothetical protein